MYNKQNVNQMFLQRLFHVLAPEKRLGAGKHIKRCIISARIWWTPHLGGCFSAQEFSFADQSMKKWVGKQHVHKEYLKKSTYLSMNGVAVAPHGLILSQGEATTSRNLSKYLPAPREAIFCPKRTKITKNPEKSKISEPIIGV